MRLIDADALLKSREDHEMISTHLIWNAPTVEPKQGEWVFKEITDDYHITGLCSVCKERRRIDNFCPNCGCRMKGADDED